jgi:putative membrane protein
MATENKFNSSINTAIKHYSSMFFLPSAKKAVLTVAVICIGLVGLSSLVFAPSINGLMYCLLFGISLFIATFFSDIILSKAILKTDKIYILRRTVALSLFCWIAWLFFMLLGVAFGVAFDLLWWVKLCLLGFSAVLTLRLIVFIATTTAKLYRQLLAALLQPFLCVAVLMTFWAFIFHIYITQFWLFLVVAPIVCGITVFLFLHSLERLGKQLYGLPSLLFFRAFMANWVVGQNAPLEELLEKIGGDEDIDVSLLKFDAAKPKAAIILPLVHPGPFKNIGSSLLPTLLKHGYQNRFNNIACTPLGILGHELDLASQAQNLKIIKHIISVADFAASEGTATPFVRVREGVVGASCQVFGKTALLSFTLAPETTEDLPQELGQLLNEEAKKLGLNCAIIVNCHNSLTDVVEVEKYLSTLESVGLKCLRKAAETPQKTFMVGAATVYPKEFSLKDGMGTGGITAIVVTVEDQKTGYVIIDGNNMMSGVREKILSAISGAGFTESEVFTTDTHAVSAIVTGRRGYHPVGEAMDHETLIKHILDVLKDAESTVEPCKAGCIQFKVPQVRVIGKERIESLTWLVDKGLARAKRLVLPLFVTEGIILILLLAFIQPIILPFLLLF